MTTEQTDQTPRVYADGSSVAQMCADSRATGRFLGVAPWSPRRPAVYETPKPQVSIDEATAALARAVYGD